MMPTLKYVKKIRVLGLLVCFSILVAELLVVKTWFRETKQDSVEKTTVLRDRTKENRLLKTTKVPKLANSTTKVEKRLKANNVEQEDIDVQIQNLLAPFVNDSLRRVLNLEFKAIIPTNGENEPTDILDIVYRKAKQRLTLLEPKVKLFQPPAKRYVYVYDRYWEQLTMNTRGLMALAAQAKLGGRFVVEPKVKDSTFGDTGYPVSTYYDVSEMNTLLRSNGYSTLVAQAEYDKECWGNDQFHAILHFLYHDDKSVSFLRNKFGITDEQYAEIARRAKKNGWTDCKFLKPYFSPSLKVFCVDPMVVTEWSTMEQGILRNVKCLGIFAWRGIGSKVRTFFIENHVKISSKEIHFLLKPSLLVLNEAALFTRNHLSESTGYIAVQIRGEKVVIQHSLTRLKKCLRVLVNIIKSTQKIFNITKVFVASDMSEFGSGSWAGILKDKSVDASALRNIQSNLIERIGAVVYKPSADWKTPDRGAVSLVEQSIIAHAQHLLTIGTGSFQDWAVAKFLAFHRDHDSMVWSLTRLCSLP